MILRATAGEVSGSLTQSAPGDLSPGNESPVHVAAKKPGLQWVGIDEHDAPDITGSTIETRPANQLSARLCRNPDFIDSSDANPCARFRCNRRCVVAAVVSNDVDLDPATIVDLIPERHDDQRIVDSSLWAGTHYDEARRMNRSGGSWSSKWRHIGPYATAASANMPKVRALLRQDRWPTHLPLDRR